MSAMQKQMARMQVNAAQAPVMVCELCTGGHSTQDCQIGNTFGQQEQINYMTNFPRGQGNSYGNPYHMRTTPTGELLIQISRGETIAISPNIHNNNSSSLNINSSRSLSNNQRKVELRIC